MARRGSYAKGVAKREEILSTALDVVARHGYRRTSVRELADAVGLSPAGLLHYFSSKEELFAEILRKRDQLDLQRYAADGAPVTTTLVDVVRHNADVPGLVQLHAQVLVEACDPEHPSHADFRDRYARLRHALADALKADAASDAAATASATVDAEVAAALLVAAADGLQTQWRLDPSIDMAAHLEVLVDLLAAHVARLDPDPDERLSP
ncbi:MAG: helix-turn-helix domain-containing protein [Terracoccus sp.]